MKSIRTKEEVDLIRPAFNSNGKLGIIEMVVLTAYERNPNRVLYFDDLVSRYKRFNCNGVVNLISILSDEESRGLQEIHTSSIDFADVTSGEFSMESAMSLLGICIGNSKLKITPLLWLFYLSEGIGNLIPEQIKAFDDVCGDFARIEEAVRSGSCKKIEEIGF